MPTVRDALLELADALADLRDEIRADRAEVHDLVVLARADLERRAKVNEQVEADALTNDTRIQRNVGSILTAIHRTDVKIALAAAAYYLIEHVPTWLRSMQ